MAMKIVILEDNEERRSVMHACLKDRFYQYEPCFFNNVPEMLACLDQHLADIILIGLDHDLELIASPDGQLVDPGTGRQVADYLAGQPASCPVVIHSTNSSAAVGMEMVLQEAHWTTCRVLPFDDLEWIAAEWLPTVRRAIVATARRRTAEPRSTS